jgi:hypothetical protein
MAKIKVEKDLYQRAEKCGSALGYSSVDEFVEHLLEKALREHEKKEGGASAVEERLKGLGYID